MSYLRSSGHDDFYTLLIANDIDESLVTELDDLDLREMGMSLGQRKKFRKALISYDSTPVNTRPIAERRQLTVAFCDLVGSTKLVTQLDVEDMREVISAYHSVCHKVMQAHGGHLAYTQGDGLMVYFGYPVAHEDDPAQAIRAGLATVEAVANLKTPAKSGLAVRIGIATGIVVVGDLIGDATAQKDFVVGETPNLASRLQGLAVPGEVLVAQETKDIAGRGFEYEHRGAPQMKGFPDGLNVYRAVDESDVQSRFDARNADSIAPLIGRTTELRQLLEAWDQTTNGQGRLCQIEGAAGIGKSRLARALLDHVADQNLTTVHLQCASHLANRALHPLTKELARAAGIVKSDENTARLSKLQTFAAQAADLSGDDVALLADLLGIATDTPLDLDAQTKALMTQRTLVKWISALAEKKPVLITFEDAHWADSSTLDFLAQLVDTLKTLPIQLLVTFRPEFEPPWPEPDTLCHVSLVPLADAAGTQLIEQITGLRKLPTLVAREIIQKTDGIPLFLEELTKAVLETTTEGDQMVEMSRLDAFSIPSTLHDSLMARLDRLDVGKKVAQLGSVIGREFSLDMLHAIAPDDLNVSDGAAQLRESGLLYRVEDSDGQTVHIFNHALVQDVAYASILRRDKSEVHKTLAEVMLTGHKAFGLPEPEVLARHCDMAGMDSEALKYWLAAGHDALGRANNLAAITYLKSALGKIEVLPDGAEKQSMELAIQMSLAPASMAIYGWGAQEVEVTCARSRELALQLGDHEALFGALWGLWTNYFLRGELEPALATALETDAMAKAAGVPMLATAADHAVGYTHFFRGEFKQALERAERGLARYTVEDEVAIIKTFQFSSSVALRAIRSATLWVMGDTEAAKIAFADALQFAEDVDHLPSLAYGLGSAGQELVLRRGWDELAKVADRNLKLSQDQGYILWEHVAAVQAAIAKGQLDKSINVIAEIDLERERFFATQTVLTDVLIFPAFAELMINAGKPEQAEARLTKVISEATRRKEALNLPEVYRMRGVARQALGNLAGAAKDFDMARQVAVDQGAAKLEKVALDSLKQLELHKSKSDVSAK
ncbi:MAG: adenylate/guanylate cyclase domain-containing protein [Sulfitobacter sp.]